MSDKIMFYQKEKGRNLNEVKTHASCPYTSNKRKEVIKQR